ncbi:hypothetical protein AKJ09_03003 [Labilithrix luteola]|uniref:Carrier domain-containing protein n=1 Tax=Labilithrix luteola TaxID=1391654 RepID=A0A0K1PT82_9BACT|nr:phosphopantetheine-binding protein [Labilithrix luteola]AKU96339.1 hypothetical protein AKJ09_03003 [Labilithrix luteola]
MKDTFHRPVALALAFELGLDPTTIKPDQDLHRDLGLQFFDVVFVAQRLEEVLAIQIPLRALDGVRTVIELTRIVSLAPRKARKSVISTMRPAGQTHGGFRS